MDDSCLICFYSFGRRELVEQGFNSLRQSRRKQDKIFVFDQQGLNLDFYLKFKSEIDFLFVPAINYEIGPVWMFIKELVDWKLKTTKVFVRDNNLEKGWYPAFVNVLECDTEGKVGWIDRVLKAFDLKNIGIASAYHGQEHPTITQEGDFLIKDLTSGVNMVFRTDYFLEVIEKAGILGGKGQDWLICGANKELGNRVAVLPNEIRHTGGDWGRSTEARGRWPR